LEPGSELKSVKEFRIYKRNLPHWEHPGSVYFITFKTAVGYNLTDAAKDITFAAIKFHTDKKYRLHACVVMKTHVHIIIYPLEESKDSFFSLAQIMHSIKSYSANKIQRALNKKGSVWLDESYDRIIRDDYDYLEKMNYVLYNPVKAGLVDEPEEYRWLFYEGSG
jgi:REP element-mobilizing transposase RayT